MTAVTGTVAGDVDSAQVVANIYDYSGAPAENVSNRFILTQAGKQLSLALRDGPPLETDRIYTFSVLGIRDAAGNAPTSGTTHVSIFASRNGRSHFSNPNSSGL